MSPAAYPRNATIHALFSSVVEDHADKIALILPDPAGGEASTLSYGQLSGEADKLARYLVSLGVKPGDPVGLYVERSLEMVVGMLAVLRIGAAFVPLDLAYPSERLSFMLEDTGAGVILTFSALRDDLSFGGGVQVVCLDEEIPDSPEGLQAGQTEATDLACILYTSGSTGRPKGVEVPHRSIVRLVMNTDYTRFDDTRVFLQLVPISFDVAEFEIWGALLHGATCVLYPAHGVPDPKLLRTLIRDYGITTLWLTTSLFNTIVDDEPELLSGVEELLIGGEALSVAHIVKAQRRLPEVQFINGYGPTESNIATYYRIPRPFDPALSSVPIGRAIANSTVYVLDDALHQVPPGTEGEIYIGGDGVARGYRNLPDKTAESFIPDPFSDEPNAKLYKTGDRARYLDSGDIDFIGRMDDQVKVDGHRIELGEIEALIRSHESVRDTGVTVFQSDSGHRQLVAYVAFVGASPDFDPLKRGLASRLPDYMVPYHWIALDKIPLTENGKLDRRALPSPVQQRPDLTQPYVAPRNDMERMLASLWQQLLLVDKVGIKDNFFELGGSSLLSLQLVNRLRHEHEIDLPIVDFFEHPVIEEIRELLEGGQAAAQEATAEQASTVSTGEPSGGGIAIIGMSGRFPGAKDIETLWKNLCDGTESITFFNDDEIDPSIPPETRNDPSFVKARGVLEDADMFDARFFGINPLEASIMDPQQRLFLEVCWETLENAGYDPSRHAGPIGVYGGMNSNTYYAQNVIHHPDRIKALGEFQAMLANESDYLTTRASFKLGLTGPSVSVYTACSTSLTAACYAVEGLRNHQCDMALAGGVSVIVPQQNGYVYQEGGMFTRDGHCRPFDADSSGTTFNSGIGMVMLKREEDALRDGDRIYAVIRGIGLNNDGSGKASFTAPSVDGQAQAVKMAQRDAGFDPASISYIETHGTGTPLGDPIEIAGLTKAFGGRADRASCAIGSIKGNIGHLIHAAGVTGLIKTALSLYHKTLPPSINYSRPNPKIDFEATPFYVNDSLRSWPEGGTLRRAGVSSFGVGGTNAHVALEEAAESEDQREAGRPRQLLLVSARSEAALGQSVLRLQQHLQEQQPALQDVAYTLQVGRQAFEYRRAVVCADRQQAIAGLGETASTKQILGRSAGYSRPLVFMFPGQGSQYLNMGRNLYQTEALFRQVMDRCDLILQDQLSPGLLAVLFAEADDAESLINQTQYTQPALFAIEYALARLLMSWGLTPSAMIGHSIGEFVAACLAGVFSLEDGLGMVARRAGLMQACPPGSMLSVRLPADEVAPYLEAPLGLAAVNAPGLCVASGEDHLIEKLKQQLEAKGAACRVLHTSHAFHSVMMDAAVEPFRAYCNEVSLSPPTMPFVSTVSGDWITQEQATDPGYWASHLRETVQFGKGIQTLWQEPERILLEVGPRTATSTLARQAITDRKQQLTLATLSDNSEDDAEWDALLQSLGRLWVNGVDIDWNAFRGAEQAGRVPLPTYPFERKRFWLDAPASLGATEQALPPENLNTMDEVTMSTPSASEAQTPDSGRVDKLAAEIRSVMEDTSGIALSESDNEVCFLDLGFDSLVLTQASLALKNKFKVDITFRELMEDYASTQELAAHLDRLLPQEQAPAPAAQPVPMAQPALATVASVQPAQAVGAQTAIAPMSAGTAGGLEQVIRGQIELMARQLEMLGLPGTGEAVPVAAPAPVAAVQAAPVSVKEEPDVKTLSHGPAVKIQRQNSESLSDEQEGALKEFIQRYADRLPKSKQSAQTYRSCLADPRTVSGFKPVWKEMIFPIVVDSSSGSKLWDIDGNEYVDLTCGFGSNMFGWSAPFIVEAVERQLKSGYEIGPQHPLAGQVAKKVAAMTGNERVAFCNTGSEAVLAAIRLSRTVTGRDKIVMFEGGYHGIIDEVIARGGANGRTFPAAPGIPRAMVENMHVFEYGAPESLAAIEAMKDEIAAVLVEPVQSRRPDLQPKEFIQSLRSITESSGSALIIDEVVTGFRVHPAGIQGYFGIHADLVTYGKVVGGGMPFGLVCGDAKFMDALDGGQWSFGDTSIPEAGVTFFAGTFVRHPLALAAANAVLDRLESEGSALQDALAEKTEAMAQRVNDIFKRAGAPFELPWFRSIFYLRYAKEMTYGGLLFALLRDKGVHIWEGRPCFLTTAHTEEDVEKIVSAFEESVADLQKMGFIAASNHSAERETRDSTPPVPGARLGRTPEGNPAWFVADEERPGKYKIVKVE